MDAITAMNGRMAEIQGRIAVLSSSRVHASSPTSGSSPSFESVLASELAGAAPSTSAGGATTSGAAKVGRYGAAQLANAAAIVTAGQAMGLSVRDQTIGVMTAMGESSLQVLDYGDTAGPDSRGLFQQRANGAWGSLADRMDPTVSATSFFTALSRVQGRDSMAPTAVAHQVQRNADPQHYTRYWDDAVAVVSRISGAST